MSVDTPNSTAMNEDKQMSLKELVLIIVKWLKYLKGKMLIIMIIAVIGMAIGFARSYFAKPKYMATSTFVLDEDKNGGGGLSLLGLGDEETKGLFQGDNLKWLYTTRLMLKNALFTEVNNAGRPELLINWFLKIDERAMKMVLPSDFNKLKFTKSDGVDSNLSITESRIINGCIGIIRSKYLDVKEVKNTESVIEVSITSYNEQFAKNLADVLVQQVNNYYIQTKTLKIAKRVKDLKMQVEEFNKKMNQSMYQTAEAVDAMPYPNPANQVNLIQPKQKGVDVELNSEIYVQMAKTLESSKIDLEQATPLIQVIDAPIYPLPINKPNLIINIVLGGIIGVVLTSIFLILRRVFNDILAT